MGDDYGRARVSQQVIFQPLQSLDVEVIGWLVQQKDVRIARDDAREAGPGALASAEHGERRVERDRAKTQTLEHDGDALFDFVASERLEFVRDAAIFFDDGIQFRPNGRGHVRLYPEQRLVCAGVFGKTLTNHLAECPGSVGLEALRKPRGRRAGAQDNPTAVGTLHARENSEKR